MQLNGTVEPTMKNSGRHTSQAEINICQAKDGLGVFREKGDSCAWDLMNTRTTMKEECREEACSPEFRHSSQDNEKLAGFSAWNGWDLICILKRWIWLLLDQMECGGTILG